MAKVDVPSAIPADSRIQEAIDFLKFSNEADTENRQKGLDDLKFSTGDQWPIEVQNSRHLEARPCLTINKLDAYVRQIVNQMRQSRPRMRAHSMNSEANAKVADIITGIFKHIEVNSDADTAYDTAGEYAVRVGWGYWRVITDYVREDSFDQEIYIKPIDNPFSVYFDPNSVQPDGSDAEKVLITTLMSKDDFKVQYPGADDGGDFNQRGTGDFDPDWVQKEDIRVAEYFYVERKKTKLLLLSDGTKVYKDEAPSPEIMAAAGIMVVGERETMRKQIKWCKLTGLEILEERDWVGRYIPVVPVYGQMLTVEDKRKKYGLVRNAKDAQRMYNYWQTSLTESIALAPKAKWLLAEGQDEGHENEWAQANIKSMPVLRYKQTDINGKEAPAPQRLQPEPPPAGVIAAAMSIDKDLQSVVGIFDPSQLPQGNMSGKAIRGQQMQQDMTNFHYYDNLVRSMKHTGRIILDLIPKIYDRERVLRIIGYDGKPEMVTVNERVQDEMGVEKVLNDVTVGEYDVYMDTGPGYQSKRQEAVEAMMPMISTNQELFNLAGDLVFRNMDFPGAEVIADRLAANNPLAQIDEKSDIPPQIQMQLMQAQKQIADMQQMIAAMELEKQYRSDVEMLKQEGETKRKLMDVTSRAYNTDTINEAKVNQQILNSQANQNKAELDAVTKMLLKRMDIGELRQVIAEKDAEQAQVAAFAEAEVNQSSNPFLQQEQQIANS
jgi:adenylate kinase family enzyme